MPQQPRFLLYSDKQALATGLADALHDLGPVIQETPAVGKLSSHMVEVRPTMVFLDFLSHYGPEAANDAYEVNLEHASMLAGELARRFPDVPAVALGCASDPGGAITAFRAGVKDFADPNQESDFLAIVERLLGQAPRESGAHPAKLGSVLLLGARPGLGVSTLASHLAGMVQQQLRDAATESGNGKPPRKTPEYLPLAQRVCLLDLGMPVGDNLLYLNIRQGFHFVDAVQNLRRLDDTLINSALPQNDAGVSVLALPRAVEQVRDASLADSIALFERLRDMFGLVITDTGGLSNPPFISAIARSCAQVWVVTDQSLGGLVSLADLLEDLAQQKVDRERLRLIVNRYDPRYGMNAAQIAERFELNLLATLPDRTLALRRSMNTGKLLNQESAADPYVKAVNTLVRELNPDNTSSHRGQRNPMGWLAGLARRSHN
ncbi:pilus assembly protein CpaE [Allopusillimonas soli]|uniref:Pilus assembly protein CpaE n=1 Tax=Allopusillimonas soli TaxID=659016 RepID=A0A853FFY3_9BURK|nr:pilus assembly protein CpaE [Allopusillimonas soli]NYT38797.1 pilus assembly protein CpaE [Allopusillimonas soli]TEA70226.1 pilus assembly protein CpaE [Allopusillimonas soli]